MKSKQFTKICPKCGNIDFPIISFAQMLAPIQEKCKKCGYAGLLPEIEINEIGKFRENSLKRLKQLK